jgi:7-carboxy-7-deazaguanine synthase (Cx14CxxC type)
MSYTVKEIFLTLQGEGVQVGRRAVFVRFSGCNLWSGREEDRAAAECQFCDTDFVGMNADGGRFADAAMLAAAASREWESGLERGDQDRFVVLTGGEPLLQVDDALIAALHAAGFAIAVETNGTIAAPAGIDWICVSPKARTEVVQRSGNELKLVWPQPGLDPWLLEDWDFEHFLVQPMDGPSAKDNRLAAIEFVLGHPGWRLSLQTHKLSGLR